MALLSMDSKFMRFMDQAADLLLLNILWLVFSLPLVTAGAATAAASALLLKGLDGEGEPSLRAFWKEFRRNFPRGTALGLAQAAALYALWLDFQLTGAAESPPIPLLAIGFASAFFVAAAFLYAYPLTARYDQSWLKTLQASVQLTFRFPGPSALLVVLLAFEAALFSWNTTMLFFGIILGPPVFLATAATTARGLFRRLEGEPPAAPQP